MTAYYSFFDCVLRPEDCPIIDNDTGKRKFAIIKQLPPYMKLCLTHFKLPSKNKEPYYLCIDGFNAMGGGSTYNHTFIISHSEYLTESTGTQRVNGDSQHSLYFKLVDGKGNLYEDNDWMIIIGVLNS